MASAIVSWHFRFNALVQSVAPPFPERAAYTETSLRDVLRLVDLLVYEKDARDKTPRSWAPGAWREAVALHAWVVYGARLRSAAARDLVRGALREQLGVPAPAALQRPADLSGSTPDVLVVGGERATRVHDAVASLRAGGSRADAVQAYGRAVEAGLSLPPTHAGASGIVFAHARIMALVFSPEFIAAHGLCDLSDATLQAWMEQAKPIVTHKPAAVALIGAVLYCDQQRHQTAVRAICGIISDALGSVTGAAGISADALVKHVTDSIRSVRASFAMTQRAAAVLGSVIPALETQQPVMVVGPSGCGKTETLTALLRMTGRRIEQVCMTPETEPSELVGLYAPQQGKAKSIAWTNAAVSRAFTADETVHPRGAALLLDNVQDANACVMERLNSVLEKPASWLLAEKGGESLQPESKGDHFLALATLSTGSPTDVSPALANRFALVFMPDLTAGTPGEAAEELTAIARVICEEGADVTLIAKVAAALWHACAASRRITDAGISMRSVVRFIDAAYHLRREFYAANPLRYGARALADSLLHSFELTIARQVADLGDVAAGLGAVVRAALGTAVGAPPPVPLDFSAFTGAGTSARGQAAHVLPESRRANAEALAACIICGYPALLEGSPAVGKTSLVEAVYKNRAGHRARLRRVNNSDTTTMQDYVGSLLPVGGGRFEYQPGELVKAMREGGWFLSDEFNLADPSVSELGGGQAGF